MNPARWDGWDWLFLGIKTAYLIPAVGLVVFLFWYSAR